jgi:phosphoribosylaminoimidazole (AIR) synthetase
MGMLSLHAGVLVFTVMYDAASLSVGLVHARVLVITAASHGNAKFACQSFGIHNNV